MALDKWEKKHVANIARYEKEIQQIYATAIAEASQMASRVSFDPSKPFAFSDYPLTKALITKLQKQVATDIEAVITKGVDTEFGLSQEKAEELAQSVYSDVENALMELRKQAYLQRRDNAREAFLMRKEHGLSLSDRVWRYTGQFKEELEMALDLGLRDGLSADELSREVRKYLNNPNMLFRRVRDEHGVLHLSKRAKAYHPGQGVYRSSYKNARRLTATETNMAYRRADYESNQALDFVVGIRVVLSNNHTLNGEPFIDICDYLSAPNGSSATSGRGCYPKDFKFTGWHPLCRCFVQTILKTPEEVAEDVRRIRQGLPPLPPSSSKNYVGDTPDEFKAWCRLNAGRVERAKSLPYFIRDNREYYDAAFKKRALTPLELAEQRHAQRTPEQAQAIKDRWHERQEERNAEFTPWTDEKAKTKFASWMRSNGINVNDKDIVVDGGFIHLQDDQHRYIYESHNYETQAEHDQLWAHQGRGRYKNSGYVQTGNSWQINKDFRKTKVTGNIDAVAEAKLKANGASDDDIKTIKLLDKKINEHSLPLPIIVTRYVDVSALKSIFGFRIKKGDFNYILSQLSGVSSGVALTPDPAYMSASTNELQNVFVNQYDVKLMIEIPPKTPMYFTNNYPESEIILGRATNLQYLSSRIGYTGRKAHIIIRCRVVR